MADVWLADYEGRPRWADDELPDVCIVCGDDATDTSRQSFRWHPQWLWVTLLLGLIPAVIIITLLSKSIPVDCPVCDRHRGHWWKGKALAALLVLGGFVLMIGGFVVGAQLERPGRPMPAWAVIVPLLVLLASLIVAVVVSRRLVRPLRITENDIRLTNVSDEFVAAVKAKRRAVRDRELAEEAAERPADDRRSARDRERDRDWDRDSGR